MTQGNKLTISLDLQPDGLTAGLAGHCQPAEKKEEKKNYASSKKLFTSIEEKGPLGKESPFTRYFLFQITIMSSG